MRPKKLSAQKKLPEQKTKTKRKNKNRKEVNYPPPNQRLGGGLRMAPPDHSGNLIVGGLHSIPSMGVERHIDMASHSLQRPRLPGPVDRGPCPAGNPCVVGRGNRFEVLLPAGHIKDYYFFNSFKLYGGEKSQFLPHQIKDLERVSLRQLR
ncbi:MAG: hypothetical protein BTN85_0097 [Candidatus Methanohalarchaeum thermophilum]|uniref:Uncharacterized protein n=1 Tax=Methanohalarchaeum thermophilum TaxID=1903181 RepID=A0A1Q6DTE7_METT1|nr:MAG: hypothetical protein BTN85_0097 [Candidatus Methanohalarchaeum thermophilum]